MEAAFLARKNCADRRGSQPVPAKFVCRSPPPGAGQRQVNWPLNDTSWSGAPGSAKPRRRAGPALRSSSEQREVAEAEGEGRSDMSRQEGKTGTVGGSSSAQGGPSITDKVRGQIEDGKAQARQKIAEGREKAASMVAQVGDKVNEKAPEPVQHALAQVQQRASERPVPVAFVAGLLTGWLIGKKRTRKIIMIGAR
jgi:hypothetical protein